MGTRDERINGRVKRRPAELQKRHFLFRLPYSEDLIDLDTMLEIIDPATSKSNGKMPLKDLLRKFG